jgi:alkylation response protein AidB-like acyl-CoA dehydrogenase
VNLLADENSRLFFGTTTRFLEGHMPISEVRRLKDDPAGFDRRWWQQGASLGWTSLLVDEEDEGGSVSGNGVRDLSLVAEAFGRNVAPGPLCGTNVVAHAVSYGGRDAHTEALTALINGSSVGAWAYQDAGGTWDPRRPTMKASRRGDSFVLDGTKTCVEYGAQADLLLVTAVVDGAPAQFLVPTDTPGVSTDARGSLDLVRRYADVTFTEVTLNAAALVGTLAGAAAALARQLDLVLTLQAAEMAGATSAVFEMTVGWAETRFAFGRPLWSYQALKHRFADMKMWVEACQATADAASAALGEGQADGHRLATIAKAYVGERSPEVIQDCVQLHGGIGVTWDHDIHLYLRRVTSDREMYGSPRIHFSRLGTKLLEEAE